MTKCRIGAHTSRLVRISLAFACAAVFAATLLMPVRADVRVERSEGGVRVEVDTAPLIEVFEVLSEKVEFHYPETMELERTVSGSFVGPLPEVVARLLNGYDYVAQTSPTGALTIIWIRPNASRRQADAGKPTTRLAPAWHRRRVRNKMPYPEPPRAMVGSIGERCSSGSPICGGSR